jgi:hypothetical protein
MRDQNNLRAMPNRVVDRGEGGAHAGIIGDLPMLVERNIEINPDQKPLPVQVEVIDTVFHRQVSGFGLRVSGVAFQV